MKSATVVFIAHFVDGGTTSEGLPYITMEYVEGRAITRYCDEGALNLIRRLRLFLKVCSAVGFAHQHLVVRRDVKPSNILVTEDRMLGPCAQRPRLHQQRVLASRYDAVS